MQQPPNHLQPNGNGSATLEVEPATTARERYHPLPVKDVVVETADAVSITFDVPSALSDTFAYVAGQFVTLRLTIDGVTAYRSYSMSSCPALDDDLRVTVKRVPGGLVSNWLHDALRAGDVLEVSAPTGAFVLGDDDDEIIAFAGGSGITPVFSLVNEALHTTGRTVRLLFANHDRGAAIFGDRLDALVASFPQRLVVEHREDVVDGFVTGGDVDWFTAGELDATFYLCGPGPFMDVVETGLRRLGVDEASIRVERFTPADPLAGEGDDDAMDGDAIDDAADDGAAAGEVVITVGRETKTLAQRGRTTILKSARWAGLPAPSSCEAGHCATCMARVVEGRVEMAANDVLTADEVAEGWVLTCQSVPVTPVVRVVYE